MLIGQYVCVAEPYRSILGSSAVRDLGVIVDSPLSWRPQIDEISKMNFQKTGSPLIYIDYYYLLVIFFNIMYIA